MDIHHLCVLPMHLRGAKSTVLRGLGWKYNVWARTAGLAGVVCHITKCRCLSLKGTPTRENSNNILCDWTSSLQENNVLMKGSLNKEEPGPGVCGRGGEVNREDSQAHTPTQVEDLELWRADQLGSGSEQPACH